MNHPEFHVITTVNPNVKYLTIIMRHQEIYLVTDIFGTIY
jgi:hypothetical protein